MSANVETEVRGGGEFSLLVKRLVRSKAALLGFFLVSLLVLVAIFAPFLAPYDPIEQHFVQQLLPPSWEHPLGTDEFGRDILSRILYGARIALFVGLLADGIGLVLGVILGLVSGYYGGVVDSLIMRLIDILLAFPYLLLAMLIVAILGPGLTNAMIAIGIVYIPPYARLVRGSVLSIKETEYVSAAQAAGAGDFRILLRHVLVNSLAPIIVQATLTIGWAIVETAGLGFLGLGAQPPTAEWGAMLSGGRDYMLEAPWIATFPGLAIVVTVIGFNLMGDGLRDVLDPKLKER
ncbi:MAG: ABC transporter permease [Nitrospinota bacterium]|nr:MAG: ABC transporter permease [Nitrospinota bacterium]